MCRRQTEHPSGPSGRPSWATKSQNESTLLWPQPMPSPAPTPHSAHPQLAPAPRQTMSAAQIGLPRRMAVQRIQPMLHAESRGTKKGKKKSAINERKKHKLLHRRHNRKQTRKKKTKTHQHTDCSDCAHAPQQSRVHGARGCTRHTRQPPILPPVE